MVPQRKTSLVPQGKKKFQGKDLKFAISSVSVTAPQIWVAHEDSLVAYCTEIQCNVYLKVKQLAPWQHPFDSGFFRRPVFTKYIPQTF